MGAGGDVAPMTEERLTEIEGDFRAADTDLHHGYLLDGLALVGEVRRLRDHYVHWRGLMDEVLAERQREVERLRADVAALERGQLLATGRAARVVWSPTGVSVRVDE
jgi:hypothetical protein